MLECDVLVVGGGFGGAFAARELERRLGHRAERVVLVTPDNFLLFSPLLAEAASGTIEPRHAVVPLRPMLKKVHVITGAVETVVPIESLRGSVKLASRRGATTSGRRR